MSSSEVASGPRTILNYFSRMPRGSGAIGPSKDGVDNGSGLASLGRKSIDKVSGDGQLIIGSSAEFGFNSVQPGPAEQKQLQD